MATTRHRPINAVQHTTAEHALATLDAAQDLLAHHGGSPTVIDRGDHSRRRHLGRALVARPASR